MFDSLQNLRKKFSPGLANQKQILYEGNSLVHIALKKKEIPHEYRVRDGGHTWTYWRESLPEVLKFVSDAFHQY